MKTPSLLLFSFFLIACGDSEPTDGDAGLADSSQKDGQAPGLDGAVGPDGEILTGDAGPRADATTGDASNADATSTDGEVSLPWFDETHLLDVSIELDPVAWQSLRDQGRDFESIFSDAMCLAQPFDSPFTYFPGSVTVDGISATNVGIRKKGFFGSLSSIKPSLKVKVHEYVPGQLLAGEKRITLNNARQDGSFARMCLAFHVFRQIGLPSPRCNFARVRVNQEDLGLYVHVEDVKKPFLRQHFTDENGRLFEGTLSDFRTEWLDSFENKADVPAPEDRQALQAVAAAAARPDSELEAALASVVDLDDFFTFWAAETLIGNWDGYTANTNNYFAYQDPTDGLFRFIPWSPDTIFSQSPFFPFGTPDSVFANGVIAHRLYQLPSGRQRYLAELRRLLDLVSEQSLHDYLDTLEAQLGLVVDDADLFMNELGALHSFIARHRTSVEEDLAMSGVDWPLPLRGIPCFHNAGPLVVDVASSFGTHPAVDAFQTGSGTMNATLDAVELSSASMGSAVGLGVNADDLGDVVIIGQAVFPSNFSLLAYVAIDASLVFPGAVIPLDDIDARGLLLRAISPVFDYQIEGFLINGTVEILEGSPADGVPFRAEIRADVEKRFRL